MSLAVSRGVIYCAVRHRLYLEAALISAFTLRRWEPDLPIVIVSNLPSLLEWRLERFGIRSTLVTIPPAWCVPHALESRLLKTDLPAWSEWAQTLYLDADVLPLRPIAPIWASLQSHPIALAVDRVPTIAQCDHIDPSERTYTLQQCPGAFPQYNSGVIVWQRSAAILNLFAAWKQEWLRFKQHDQLALARALYATRQPVSVLNELDNFPVSHVTPTVIQQNQVRLLHCLGGFITCGRFHALAARLAPQPTALARRVLDGG